jgi:hypothetical protein
LDEVSQGEDGEASRRFTVSALQPPNIRCQDRGMPSTQRLRNVLYSS